MHYIDILPLRSGSSHRDDCADFVCRLNMRGNLCMDNSGETAILMRALISGGFRRIILNLENLNYVDSTGIGTIIRIKKDILQVNGDMVLCNVPPKVNEVFELVNLKEFVKIFYSEQKALDALKNSGSPEA